MRTGNVPVSLALDGVHATLYVANVWDGTVAIIDAAHCTAVDPCRHPRLTFPVASRVGPLAVDESTHTLYVAGYDTASGPRIWIIDTATCNAADQSSCRQRHRSIVDPGGPEGFAIDPVTHTLYVGNDDYTTSVIDAAHCNAVKATRCKVQANISPAGGTDGLPVGMTVDVANHTLYVVEAYEILWVVDVRRCNGQITSGCARPRPAGFVNAGYLRADPSAHTVYVVGNGSGTLTMIDDRTCNARVRAGCSRAPQVNLGRDLASLALVPATHTLYVGDDGAGRVLALPELRCNAMSYTRCRSRGAVAVVAGMADLAADDTTQTLFVTGGQLVSSPGGDTSDVYLVNMATCSARGCGRHPGTPA